MFLERSWRRLGRCFLFKRPGTFAFLDAFGVGLGGAWRHLGEVLETSESYSTRWNRPSMPYSPPWNSVLKTSRRFWGGLGGVLEAFGRSTKIKGLGAP